MRTTHVRAHARSQNLNDAALKRENYYTAYNQLTGKQVRLRVVQPEAKGKMWRTYAGSTFISSAPSRVEALQSAQRAIYPMDEEELYYLGK